VKGSKTSIKSGMKRKKYELTEEGEIGTEELITIDILYTLQNISNPLCQKIIIIIIIIIPQWTNSRHLALTSSALGLQTFLIVLTSSLFVCSAATSSSSWHCFPISATAFPQHFFRKIFRSVLTGYSVIILPNYITGAL